jgi:hypothetical protein
VRQNTSPILALLRWSHSVSLVHKFERAFNIVENLAAGMPLA